MRKTLLIFILLLVSVSLFAKEADVYYGIAPYSLQRCYRFSPNRKTVDSVYSFCVNGGYRSTSEKGMSWSADVLVGPYIFENNVNEMIAVASLKVGYDSNWKSPFGMSAALGVGVSLCLTDNIFRAYLSAPAEIGVKYSVSDSYEVFMNARLDGILLFNKELRRSSISGLASCIMGMNHRIGE